MESSLVKIDNIMAWNGVKVPFVEHYTLFLHDPKGLWGLCLRFSFEIQDTNRKLGRVEAFFQNQEGQKIHLKNEWDLDRFDVVHADKFIEMGETWLSLSVLQKSYQILFYFLFKKSLSFKFLIYCQDLF